MLTTILLSNHTLIPHFQADIPAGRWWLFDPAMALNAEIIINVHFLGDGSVCKKNIHYFCSFTWWIYLFFFLVFFLLCSSRNPVVGVPVWGRPFITLSDLEVRYSEVGRSRESVSQLQGTLAVGKVSCQKIYFSICSIYDSSEFSSQMLFPQLEVFLPEEILTWFGESELREQTYKWSFAIFSPSVFHLFILFFVF